MDNLEVIINELSNLNPPERSFDNQLIIRALAVIGNPQNNYKVIHIAGTNGKGSTAAFIESGLLAAGYQVAKYSSPYIHKINECITINRQIISDTELANLYLQYKQVLLSANIYLSSFEMLTLLMFVYSKIKKVDYLVLETGLGGRDDATNVVDSIASVITNISLEHTQFLGDSLEKIAEHKAGIIKNGLTVIGDNSQFLLDAVNKKTSSFTSIKDKYVIIDVQLNYTDFTTELTFREIVSSETKHITLGLLGYFQVYNFLCAYEVLCSLAIKWHTIVQAANEVVWHGRLEKIADSPLKIADASHNVDGVRNLAQSLHNWFPFQNSIIVCSILSDKNISEMLDHYSQISENILFCAIPDQPRTSHPNDLASAAAGKFRNIYTVTHPQQAQGLLAAHSYAAILISGSCYLLKYFL